ncbi:PIN domain nuclease of toxin-antitoxin system [Modicisalibacter xianhensis]|uniref:PIN domain nuclease of toxin-antitoxin system n=1 Tax=Modicisalibacter xianhensis TaxID=442341 RepID=A0A4R8FMP8_9GAMM|nr:type II toxin-antitoxin system VapC family toxin [Halomonas xianhensis]TDX27600.1 PIN domain nuclease of toxin-antitoxin system [Halomonas xianhensis]
MRRLLLDTHAFLWWLADDPKLGSRARELIADSQNRVFVSAASIWEISIKKQLGKLEAPDDMERILEEEGFLPLAIEPFHGEQAGNLPMHHRDPFDRMLIAQAQAEGLTLVTADNAFPPYGIRLVSAYL